MMAILLPAIALEDTFKTEKARLEQLVKLRTSDLKEALQDKETLLKILVHDISTPLTVMRWYLHGITKDPSTQLTDLDKVIKSQDIVENIVKKVRLLQAQPSASAHHFRPVSIMSCLDELKFLFDQTLKAKNIKLEIIDDSHGENIIKADPFSLTHNVISNFLNNAIKFSHPDSTIKIHLACHENQVELSIQDFGIGIDASTLQHLMKDGKVESTPGTSGELGSGLGFSIAKAVLKNMKGKLEIHSQESEQKGTIVKLSFPVFHNHHDDNQDLEHH